MLDLPGPSEDLMKDVLELSVWKKQADAFINWLSSLTGQECFLGLYFPQEQAEHT